MRKLNFNEMAKALSAALIDDFKGFLVEGEEQIERVEVPEGVYHLEIAMREMSKEPNWKYESGVGQNPIIDYLKEKGAIYITKLPKDNNNKEFQWTVGYLTDTYNGLTKSRGRFLKEYEKLREIAIGQGYDADEYTLLERTENSVKTPVTVKTYKGEIYMKSHSFIIPPKRKVLKGDQPVFDKNHNILGFISYGKFYNIKNYPRYADIGKKYTRDTKNNEDKER